MHLVGFIIRIYHDAQPPERQKGEYNWSIFQLCVANVSSSQYLTASRQLPERFVQLGKNKSAPSGTNTQQGYYKTVCCLLR